MRHRPALHIIHGDIQRRREPARPLLARTDGVEVAVVPRDLQQGDHGERGPSGGQRRSAGDGQAVRVDDVESDGGGGWSWGGRVGMELGGGGSQCAAWTRDSCQMALVDSQRFVFSVGTPAS